MVFTVRDAEEAPTARHLTLEDARIRELVSRLPYFVPGQPIPSIVLPDLQQEVKGTWSLWRIAVASEEGSRQRIMPVFLHDDGRSLMPTARHIWDQLMTVYPRIGGYIKGQEADRAFARISQAAEVQGKAVYDELMQEHRERLAGEREKGEYAFAARRRAIERIGLPAVRNHRLTQLAQEERRWHERLEKRAEVQPEPSPLLICYIADAK